MAISTRFSRPSDNPVVASRHIVLVNLARELVSRPFLSSLLAVLCLCILALVAMILYAVLVQHAGTLLGWLTDRAVLLWSAVFLLCLASQVPPSRREIKEAQTGWLSALPQMPQAMRRWSHWRRSGLAMLQSLGLLMAVVLVYRQAAPEAAQSLVAWLAPVAIPFLAAVLAPGMARPGRRSNQSLPPTARPASPARPSAPILVQWQWALYRSHCWSAGIRWSLGFLIVLMPAGASTIQVAIALVIGLILLQLAQLWSSATQVIFQASRLVRALPSQPWVFIREVSGLPLLIALGLSLMAGLVLTALGMSSSGAVIAGFALFGALSLHLATVLAWRQESRFSGLRSAIVLLVWLALSQTAAVMAPVVWFGLIGWLVHRAVRVAP